MCSGCVGKKYSRRKNDAAACAQQLALLVWLAVWLVVGWSVRWLVARSNALAGILVGTAESISRARLIGFLFTLTPMAHQSMCECVCDCLLYSCGFYLFLFVFFALGVFCVQLFFLPAFSDCVADMTTTFSY